ncbi:MAG: DNA translocase FtsK, partial [Betaproteobacteria bacterium]
MIFNKNDAMNNRRARRSEASLSPKAAALVRESWWLLVVALLTFLTLTLASYHKTDAGWSYSGTGAMIQNKGGAVGAWLSDLLFYLFGFSAWWWVFAGIVLVVAGYKRMIAADRVDVDRRHHPLLAVPGFVVLLLASAALEGLRLYRLPAMLPQQPGGAIGDVIGSGLARALGFNGATLLLIALLAIGWTLLTGMSWLKLMERIGGGIEGAIAWARKRREEHRDRQIGAAALEQREHAVEAAREIDDEREPVIVVPSVAEVPKSERVVKERQKPLFQDMPDSP